MSQPYVGEIRLFGFNFAPQGWQRCDGSLLAISENDALFSLIGTIYGGDGQVTFAVPDLRGRVPVHQGQGPGLSIRQLGEQAGTEAVTLLTTQMPAHNHAVVATSAAATTGTPGVSVIPGAVANQTMYVTDTDGGAAFPLAPQAIGPGGGSQPHENCMPTLAAQFCISLFGIYPSQN